MTDGVRGGAGSRGELARGLRAGLPIAVGYLPVAITFGILARQTGLSITEAAGMSLIVYAGASQFMSLPLIAGGSSAAAIALATFVLNLRHFLMSASLSQKMRVSRGAAAGLGLWVTDETFVVATLDGRPTPWYFAGLGAAAYTAWAAGTVIGSAAAPLVPRLLSDAMGVGLYAMFVAILVPAVRTGWRNALIAVFGALIAWGLGLVLPALPFGWRIITAILAASAVGLAFPEEAPA
jgi:4-azaleucine resistance transporter AzlC